MSHNSADLVLHNAKVMTLDQRRRTAELVAIKDGKILAVASGQDLGLYKGPETKLMDCQGRTIVPGFNDAHCHPISFAMTLLHVDCSPSSVKSIKDLQAKIGQRAQHMGKSQWIRAAKYNETRLSDNRHPTRGELDEAAPDNPVILIHDSGKTCILNSLALQLVGITKDSVDPPGGHLGRDEQTRELTGMISGRNEQVEKGVPPLDQQELQQGISLANQEYLSHGITSLQDTTWSNGFRHWRFYQDLKESGALLPRITMMVGTDAVEECRAKGLHTGFGDSQLRVGGVKIALDESTGCEHPPQTELNSHALRAHQAGFQLAFHVHDVHTLQAALAALQFITLMDPKPYTRPRLEHCAICPPALVPKLKTFDVMVVTQPSFLYYLGETFRRDVPMEERGWLYPLRSFRAQGINVATSSDSPLFPCNPLIGMYAAVTRKDEEGQAIAPQESVSSLDALRMYTQGPAYVCFEEDFKGSISPGKVADLVVLSADPTEIDPEGIMGIKVMLTIIDGKVAWERKSLSFDGRG